VTLLPPNSVLKTPNVETPALTGPSNGGNSSAPFFIVGLGRAGTTLLSRMLDANSDIAVFPETWCYVVLDRLGCLRSFEDPWQYRLFVNQIWDNLRSYNDPAARAWAEEAARRPTYVGPTAPILESFGRMYAEAKGARIWGEKTPGHVLWLPHIHHLFPNAKIIVAVRDPRDVLVSYDDRWGGGRRDPAFLMQTAALIRYYLRRLFDDRGFPPSQFFLVKYEELTSRPIPLLKEVCQFLDVDFQPGMVGFHVRSADWMATSEAKHHALLSRPATTERVGRYRSALTQRQITAIDEFLAAEMQSLGYAKDCSEVGESSVEDTRAIARAQREYERMQAGVFRRKLRRRGKLVLTCYKHLGPALSLLPARRVASTAQDWIEKAASTSLLEDKPSARSLGATLDEEILGVSSSTEERGDQGRQSDSKHAAAPNSTESAKFRERVGQISQHSAMFFAGTMFAGLAGYLFRVYLARVIGAEALGIYALGMTIVALLGVFNGLGLSQAAVRFIPLYSATGKSNQLRGFLLRALTLLVATNLVFALAVVALGPWVAQHVYHTAKLRPYLPLFSLIMLLGALTNYGGLVLQGYKDVARRTVITNFIGTPLVIVLTIAFLVLGWGLWGYIFAQVVSAVIVLGLLVVAAWKLTPSEVFQHKGPLPPLGSQVVSFGIAALGIALLDFFLAQTDKILIGFYLNPKEVGIYALAMAVVAFVPIALSSVNQIFSPTIADLHSRGERELLERLFQTLTRWILGFTLPLAIVVVLFAQPLMRVFGADFASGWPVLVIGTIGQLANCGTGSVGYLLMMSGNQNRLVKVQATMAFMMVLLNIFLIPKYGILGAVVVAALTNVCTNLWNLAEVRSALGFSPYNRSYVRLLPAGIATVVAELVLKRFGSAHQANLPFIVISVILGYLVFSVSILAFGLDRDDRLIADAVWKRLGGGLKRAKADF
jgi:O-antigen/teichoic acid export membrane protein